MEKKSKTVAEKGRFVDSLYKVVIPAVIVFLATLSYMPSAGILRTVPFMLVSGIVAGLFGMGTYASVICGAVFSLCTYLVHGKGVLESVLFAVLAVVFVLGGVYVGKLVKTAVKTVKLSVRRKCFVYILAVMAVEIVFACIFCGNAFSYVKYNKLNTHYVEKYYGDSVNVRYSAYEWLCGEVRTYVTFKEGDTVVGADDDCYISTKNGKVTDNVRDCYEEAMLTGADKELAKMLINVTGAFEITESDIDLNNGEILTKTSSLDDYKQRVSYVVSFYSFVEEKADFEVLCRDALVTVNGNGFEYNEIVFCAGNAEKMLFSFRMDKNTKEEDVKSLVKNYDDKDVARFGIDEKTILDYWQ